MLGGANLALLGDEIIQFTSATALAAAGSFRLSGLLRGRRGTEAAMTTHLAGERFVLLDTARLTAFDPAPEAIGSRLRFKAVAAGAGALVIADLELAGRALRPLSPVHLDAASTPAGIAFRWLRRSRAGFGWPDGSDVPLAEETEAYRLVLRLDGRMVRTVEVSSANWVYPHAQFTADGGVAATLIGISVAQLSAVTGGGSVATALFPRASL